MQIAHKDLISLASEKPVIKRVPMLHIKVDVPVENIIEVKVYAERANNDAQSMLDCTQPVEWLTMLNWVKKFRYEPTLILRVEVFPICRGAPC